MSERWKAYGGATLLAAGIVASAALLRGWPGKDWIDAALYMAMGWYMATFIMPSLTSR